MPINKILPAGLGAYNYIIQHRKFYSTACFTGPLLCYIISMTEQYGFGDPLVDPAEAKIECAATLPT